MRVFIHDQETGRGFGGDFGYEHPELALYGGGEDLIKDVGGNQIFGDGRYDDKNLARVRAPLAQLHGD